MLSDNWVILPFCPIMSKGYLISSILISFCALLSCFSLPQRLGKNTNLNKYFHFSLLGDFAKQCQLVPGWARRVLFRVSEREGKTWRTENNPSNSPITLFPYLYVPSYIYINLFIYSFFMQQTCIEFLVPLINTVHQHFGNGDLIEIKEPFVWGLLELQSGRHRFQEVLDLCSDGLPNAQSL